MVYDTIPPSYDYIQTTQFEGQLSDGGPFGWSPIYLTSDIFANLPTDPQGLELFFGWELVNSPTGDLVADFIPDNGNFSRITFRKRVGFTNVIGDYNIRLKVTNSVGFFNIIDLTVLGFSLVFLIGYYICKLVDFEFFR